MIQEVKKKRRRAEDLAQIWKSYFSIMPVGVEYWMVSLDDFPFNVLALAIKQAARKRVQLKGEMTLEQVLAYVQSVCRTILKEKVAQHIYPEKKGNYILYSLLELANCLYVIRVPIDFPSRESIRSSV